MMNMKCFLLAAASLAFAACSNDNGGEEQGELLPNVNIKITDSRVPGTRAMDGTTSTGVGTENDIYHAFIFAKEAKPGHANPLVGDWTVKELGTLSNATALNGGGASITAEFKNIRQGDHVYVIANHPTLTLTDAEAIAHNGASSESRIKSFLSQVNKTYLNGLTWARYTTGGVSQQPSGKFLMGGMAQLPLTTIPDGATLTIDVPVDRELAKVNLTAKVSDLDADIAKGKVEFKAGDGIVIARVVRSVTPFTTSRTGGAYISMPYQASVIDWPSASAVGGKLADVTLPAFNTAEPASTIGEYRYAYTLASGDMNLDINTDRTAAIDKQIFTNNDANPTLYAPMFYVTPNYSDDSNATTVVCVQATYTGASQTVNGIAYAPDDKVFYRVDVADYIAGVSQKHTQRNVAYTTRGTIRALGAKTIYEAITTNNNTMTVSVTVNPWKLSLNDVDM